MSCPTLASGLSLAYPFDALASYYYFRDDERMAAFVALGRLRLIGDSGAYSAWASGATIGLAEYADWVSRWRDHLCWAASLDVINDPQATWRNWDEMRQRYGLLTVPTLHAGGDTRWLDRYVAEGVDLIGLGGMASAAGARKAFRWMIHVFRYARDRYPYLRFHLWGVAGDKPLEVLPAWSADTSGSALESWGRYGLLRLYDPDTQRRTMIYSQPASRPGSGRVTAYQMGSVLRRTYGIQPDTIAVPGPTNRLLAARLVAASTQQYAIRLQARHHVSPPSMYSGSATTGPRLHCADGGGTLIGVVSA